MRSSNAIALLLAFALAGTAAGCAKNSAEIRVTGSIAADEIAIEAPALAVAAGSSATGSAAASAAATSAVGVPGSYVRVVSVEASEGAHVSAGQVLVRLDAQVLEANAELTQANIKVAESQVGVLEHAIDDVISKRADLRSARAKLTDAIAQLKAQRAQLARQAEQIEATLATLAAAGAAGATPSAGATASAPPGAPNAAQLTAALAQLRAALAKIDAGLAQVQAGVRQLDSAAAKLDDAETQLRDLREIALIAVDAANVAARAAEYQVSLTVVRSPADSVLTSIAKVGDCLAPGATLAVVRPDSAAKVTTWLDAEQIARVALGNQTTITGDWMGAGAHASGTVTRIGLLADYPPTSFSTDAVHMTRAVPVEITVDSSGEDPSVSLPAGAPVDIIIRASNASGTNASATRQ